MSCHVMSQLITPFRRCDEEHHVVHGNALNLPRNHGAEENLPHTMNINVLLHIVQYCLVLFFHSSISFSHFQSLEIKNGSVLKYLKPVLPHPVNMLALGNAATDIIGERVSSCSSVILPWLGPLQLVQLLHTTSCQVQHGTAHVLPKQHCLQYVVYVGKEFLWECRNLFKYFQMASQCSNRCWDVGPAAVLWHRTGGHGLRLTTRRIWTASQEVTKSNKRWQEMTRLQEPSEKKKWTIKNCKMLRLFSCDWLTMETCKRD